MDFRNILISVDASDNALRAVEYAAAILGPALPFCTSNARRTATSSLTSRPG